ncbi:KTSC domain-containing protein [Kineococcus aurantiacus]|uniref:KTSC domain-containing protein n=1 Tax=Kineococcus aurantiacus TaxID=37633 RepID=A0A7Y9DQS8_9ACTN|nr:KTSC domain-containing protein [Kineococcus aurantiacus]NYD25038.1 hypothetical protein [Kineococcus aurantiacus]
MQIHPVTSGNVASVGYDPDTRTLRVRFRSGGTYDYADVDVALFHQMLQPHPWHRLHQQVKKHHCTLL